MKVLLLRLTGPMQSWGTQSRFTVRDTGLEPSKSGVVGLACAALGRQRAESVDDIASLRMGVRADQEGTVKSDFQTAGGSHVPGEDYGVPTADASGRRAVTSTRYYLADADFLVGLAGHDVELLNAIQEALRSPRWPLFLGRKSFPPSLPVYLPDGLLEGELRPTLEAYPRCPRRSDREDAQVRFVLEDVQGELVRMDQPVAPFAERRFAARRVTMVFKNASHIPVGEDELCTSHG